MEGGGKTPQCYNEIKKPSAYRVKFGCESGINKGFVLALNSEMRLLKLNSSKHIKVYCFLFKSNDLLHQFTSMEFTEVTMAIH